MSEIHAPIQKPAIRRVLLLALPFAILVAPSASAYDNHLPEIPVEDLVEVEIGEEGISIATCGPYFFEGAPEFGTWTPPGGGVGLEVGGVGLSQGPGMLNTGVAVGTWQFGYSFSSC